MHNYAWRTSQIILGMLYLNDFMYIDIWYFHKTPASVRPELSVPVNFRSFHPHNDITVTKVYAL